MFRDVLVVCLTGPSWHRVDFPLYTPLLPRWKRAVLRLSRSDQIPPRGTGRALGSSILRFLSATNANCTDKLLTVHQNTSHKASHHTAEWRLYHIGSRVVLYWRVLCTMSSCSATVQVTPHSGVPRACFETWRYMFVRVLFISDLADICPVLYHIYRLSTRICCTYSRFGPIFVFAPFGLQRYTSL